MDKSELDARLARFLNDQEENPPQTILKRIADNQLTHEKLDQDRHAEVKGLLQDHGLRIANLERRADRLEDREEDTATRDRRTLELAARAEGIALGKMKRDPKSEPPAARLIARAASSGIGKAIGIAVVALTLLGTGWLSRECGVGVSKDAVAKTAK